MIENDSKVLQLLGDVMKLVLVENQEITDDTLLEKLMTAIEETLQNKVRDVTYLLMALNPKTWIVQLLADEEMDSSSVSFGLRILGLIAKSSGGSLFLKTEGVSLTPVLDSILLKFKSFDAVIRSAVIEMLTSACCDSDAAAQIFTREICDIVARCICDESIFVARAAQRLTAKVVALLIRDASVGTERCSQLFQRLLKPLEVSTLENNPSLSSLLTLQLICANQDSATFLKQNCDIVNKLSHFFKHSTESLQLYCLELQVLLLDDGNMAVKYAREMLPELMTSCKPLITLKFIMFVSNRLVEFGDVLPADLIDYFTVPMNVFTIQEDGLMSSSPENREPLRTWWEKLEGMTCTDDSFRQMFCFAMVCIPQLSTILKNKDEKLKLVWKIVGMLERGLDARNFCAFNRRLQAAVLDCLQALVKGEEFCGSTEDCLKLISRMIHFFYNYSLTTTKLKLLSVISSVVKIWGKCCISKLGNNSLDLEVFSEIGELIRRCCSDVQWENRDGGLEILRELADIYRVGGEEESFMKWFKINNFQRLTIDLLTDEESYIRAGLLKLFSSLNPHHEVWNKENVISYVCKFLRDDPEGIVRREAVSTLLQWHKDNRISVSCAYNWMRNSAHDFDWEVKLTTVAFWDLVCRTAISQTGIDKTISENTCGGRSSKAKEFLERLDDTGYYEAMMALVNDHDVSVRHQALNSVLAVRKIIDKYPEVCGKSECDARVSEGEESAVAHCEQNVTVRSLLNCEDRDDVIEDILSTNYGLLARDIFVNRTDDDRSSTHELILNERGESAGRKVSTVTFVGFIRNLDVEGLIVETGKPSDIYTTDIEALLGDILANGQPKRDNNQLDCY